MFGFIKQFGIKKKEPDEFYNIYVIVLSHQKIQIQPTFKDLGQIKTWKLHVFVVLCFPKLVQKLILDSHNC